LWWWQCDCGGWMKSARLAGGAAAVGESSSDAIIRVARLT
jgi:hypothetical protein